MHKRSGKQNDTHLVRTVIVRKDMNRHGFQKAEKKVATSRLASMDNEGKKRDKWEKMRETCPSVA